MNTGTRRDVIDVLVLGDLNADSSLTGDDLLPRFGQVEALVDDAGYVFGLLSGLPLAEKLRVASLCGARSTEGLGGATAQITGQELRSALSESPS